MNGFLAIAIPMLCCLLGSLSMGLLYCFLTVTLRANQNVTGLAMTTFGVGFGNFFGGSLIKLVNSDVPSIALSATSSYFSKSLPFAGVFDLIFRFTRHRSLGVKHLIAVLVKYGRFSSAEIIFKVEAGATVAQSRLPELGILFLAIF